jgi:hypothetical protein
VFYSPIKLNSGVPLRTCTVSFVGPTAMRHAVEVTAESLYEAAILGVALRAGDGSADVIAPGTHLEIQVRRPAMMHCVSVAQLRRWCEGIAVRQPNVAARPCLPFTRFSGWRFKCSDAESLPFRILNLELTPVAGFRQGRNFFPTSSGLL